MLKKIGFTLLTAAAGTMALGGVASAQGHEDHDQVGLVNLDNVDVLHNVNATIGFCDNEINVLGVQVPVEDVLNGLGAPVGSPGHNEAEGQTPDNCASGGVVGGGSVQDG